METTYRFKIVSNSPHLFRFLWKLRKEIPLRVSFDKGDTIITIQDVITYEDEILYGINMSWAKERAYLEAISEMLEEEGIEAKIWPM